MTSDRQRKIGLLSRKNAGKLASADYLHGLSIALRRPVIEDDLLGLEATDTLIARFNADAAQIGPNQALSKTWTYKPTRVWTSVCLCLANMLRLEDATLFVGQFDICGAVRTRAGCPLENADAVIKFDGDTLRIQAASLDGGLYIDLYREEGSDQAVELKVWGKWALSAVECVGVEE